ncbi:MAG: amidohydrolase family protein [Verrucomicrobiota bacterium]
MSKPLFEVNAVDRQVYETKLRDFLPRKMIDIHTHAWRSSDVIRRKKVAHDKRIVSWPARVAKDSPIEELQETYRLMFPDKQVTPLIFPIGPSNGNLGKLNAYASKCHRRHKVPALIWSDPKWSAEELERRIIAGGFSGAKSYLIMAPSYLPGNEIRCLDFFPPHQLEVHNRHGWAVMLHIPRDGRLKDPVNLQQMLEIEREYPHLKLIIAHVGRAYCDHDIGNAFEVLANSKRMYFDFCANTNANVFTQLIRCVGPRRILFGSDLPITRMRMRRVTSGDHYVNLVPKGLYGDVSGDKNMGEVTGAAAAKLTFFLYEQILAFRQAAERTGLTAGDVEDVFYRNAVRLLRLK